MKRVLVIGSVLALVIVMASLMLLTLLPSTASSLATADATPTVAVYLPIAIKQPTPTPTPTPPLCQLYVQNDTGGTLCYEVYGTAIGQRCFGTGGPHYYGTFPAGTYSWYVSALCGSASGSDYYPTGDQVHEFWCGAASQSTTPSVLLDELQ